MGHRAKKRGLSNIKNTPEALKAYISKQAIATFVENGIFTKEELHARYEIMLEDYMKKIQIEGRVLGELIYSFVLPPAIEYLTTLATNVKSLKEAGLKAGAAQSELIKDISSHIDAAKSKTDKMVDARKKANKMTNSEKQAVSYHYDIKESFDGIRVHADKLEHLIDDKIWDCPNIESCFSLSKHVQFSTKAPCSCIKLSFNLGAFLF